MVTPAKGPQIRVCIIGAITILVMYVCGLVLTNLTRRLAAMPLDPESTRDAVENLGFVGVRTKTTVEKRRAGLSAEAPVPTIYLFQRRGERLTAFFALTFNCSRLPSPSQQAIWTCPESNRSPQWSRRPGVHHRVEPSQAPTGKPRSISSGMGKVAVSCQRNISTIRARTDQLFKFGRGDWRGLHRSRKAAGVAYLPPSLSLVLPPRNSYSSRLCCW